MRSNAHIKPKDLVNKHVLISPLNWGMGHVSRCIPIVQELLNQSNHIYIACNTEQKEIFQSYFTESNNLKFINHEGYPFRFKGKGNFTLDLISTSIQLYRFIQKEKRIVDAFVDLHQIDYVISDHRYGFHSNKCTTIFITHQLNLPLTGISKIFQKFHHTYIHKFTCCWILDTVDSKFAGKLSKNKKNFKCIYIGIKSRFELYTPKIKDLEQVYILNGPKVYAEQLFKSIDQFQLENSIILSSRTFDSDEINAKLIISQDWQKQDDFILRAKKIYAYFGYSTLMDLAFLKTNFELSPTIGQNEQIYLSILHKDISNFKNC